MKLKIINYLKGGIGNQLFQYAFSKSLALKFECELFHDISYYRFDPYGNRSVIEELDPLAKFINTYEKKNSKILKMTDGIVSSLDEISRLPEGVDYLLLDGYWQNENYHHNSVIEMIKKLFHDKYKTNAIDLFEENNSIAVHIRRKDYEHMGLCKPEYYTGIMNYFFEQKQDTEFKIYTDTLNFTKHFLSVRNYNLNYVNTGSDLKDLYMMSLSKKFIISNSTYSWWAAYLGERDATEIFAPKSWVTLPNVKSPCPLRWKLVDDAIVSSEINTELDQYFFNQVK